jgi:putative membrane protein
MRFTRIAMSVAAGLLLVAGGARADQAKDEKKPDEKKPALTDAELQAMAKLHHANTMEIDMGKLGTERAKSADVKSYGSRMMRDHKKADGKLMALAKKHGVTLEAPTPKDDAEKRQMDEQMATMTKLRSLEGEAFDREYMAAMVKDHAAALQLVSDTRTQAKDASLLSFLKGVQPVIQQHYDAAQKLVTKLNEQPSKGG